MFPSTELVGWEKILKKTNHKRHHPLKKQQKN